MRPALFALLSTLALGCTAGHSGLPLAMGDAAMPEGDAAPFWGDAGDPAPDAGLPEVDAAEPTPDAGAPEADAATADGGTMCETEVWLPANVDDISACPTALGRLEAVTIDQMTDCTLVSHTAIFVCSDHSMSQIRLYGDGSPTGGGTPCIGDYGTAGRTYTLDTAAWTITDGFCTVHLSPPTP